MYNKMFELINDEINNIIENTLENKLELKKIEIKGIKVKLVFFNHNNFTIKVMIYELDLFSFEPKLKFKKDYLKPYTDKYFR